MKSALSAVARLLQLSADHRQKLLLGCAGLLYTTRVRFVTCSASSLYVRVAVRDSFQLRQQILDTGVQQFAGAFALFVFVTRKQTEFPVERFEFFLYAPDLSKHSLNLVEHAGVFTKWEVPTL